MVKSRHSITLLFNANKVYDRQVIEGIGHYLQSSKVDWDIYLEEDFRTRLDHINDWAGDGIIADFDDIDIQRALQHSSVPVVGVGGSYTNPDDYPDVPYVATDNVAVVNAAFEHLRQKGIERFAYYGVPINDNRRWALERERAIKQLMFNQGFDCQMYRGHVTSRETWQSAMSSLSDWLQSLTTPIGIIAVTDARARHILQVCEHLGIEVPDRISVVGIDDDDIARHLSRISLSSVTQGCFEMGYKAAGLLHKQLQGINVNAKRATVLPLGVASRQSSDFKSLKDAHVIQAMHYIRQNATKGIKVDQVTDYVGISRSNLELRFQAECGHSVHAEIHNEKLSRACKMLEETNVAPIEIAAICGYPSLQYMYAVFKKHFNKTPKAYREQNNAGGTTGFNG